MKKKKEVKEPEKLEEGKDFYIENGLFVLTKNYLLRRGYCCGNGCRHCPYTPKHQGNQPNALHQ